MWVSKKKFTLLVIKDITWRVLNTLKSWIKTEVHPRWKNAWIAVVKWLTAYGVGQLIWHEFYVIPNIEDIVQMYEGTIETSTEVYENREEIKNSIIEILKEKEFMDYVRGIWNIISEVMSSIWNLPLKEKFWAYLELAVFWAISGYIKNFTMKHKSWRDMAWVLKRLWDNPELRERFFRMRAYRKNGKG